MNRIIESGEAVLSPDTAHHGRRHRPRGGLHQARINIILKTGTSSSSRSYAGDRSSLSRRRRRGRRAVPDDQPLHRLGGGVYQFSLDQPGHLALPMTYESTMYGTPPTSPPRTMSAFVQCPGAFARIRRHRNPVIGGTSSAVSDPKAYRAPAMQLLWGQVSA
jgi:hypothetical protein